MALVAAAITAVGALLAYLLLPFGPFAIAAVLIFILAAGGVYSFRRGAQRDEAWRYALDELPPPARSTSEPIITGRDHPLGTMGGPPR